MLDMLYWWIYFLFYSVCYYYYQMLLDYFNSLYRYDDKVHSLHSISKKQTNPIAYNFSIIICDVFINMLGKLTIALSLTSKHMQMTF